MRYWCFGAGKIGRKFLFSSEKVLMGGDIIGYVDRKADYIRNVDSISVYTYDAFKELFAKKSDKIIITMFADLYIDQTLYLLGKDGLLDFVAGIYKGDELREICKEWQNSSTSQYGEDMALKHLIASGMLPPIGVYLDVGAYHPFRYSNTFFLYQKGWHGINIDANVEAIKLFDIFRKEDININSGVSDCEKSNLIYYMFEESAYNTFDRELAEDRKSKSRYLGAKQVPVQSLNDILAKENISQIDYLNIDVEGLDEKVVMTFDFERYKPRCISIEVSVHSIEEHLECNMHKLFLDKGYCLFAYYWPTAIYTMKD